MKYLLALLLLTFYTYASDAFIAPDSLKELLKDEKLVLLDVSSMYDTSHIAGALYADVSKFTKSRYGRLASAYSKNVQKEIINLGINPNSHVVIYSRNSYDEFQNATYLAFVLIEHGFENISILDGGYMAWVFEYHTLVSSKKSSAKDDGTYEIKHNPNLLIESEYINRNSRNIAVVERDYRDNFYDDLTLRGKDELNEFASELSPLKDKEIAVHNESIFKASINWYILYKKLGFKNVKILHF
jgi:thiosulfate/3-mercaptopyruvate sulfurtransferase